MFVKGTITVVGAATTKEVSVIKIPILCTVYQPYKGSR